VVFYTVVTPAVFYTATRRVLHQSLFYTVEAGVLYLRVMALSGTCLTSIIIDGVVVVTRRQSSDTT
jgi:hypothetical protein